MTRVERKLHIRRGSTKRNVIIKQKSVIDQVCHGRTQRISKLMALAIWFEELLSQGVVKDQTELAILMHVSQPRITQIMTLLLLSPDIQEELLFLPRVTGKDVVTEKMLRPVAAEVGWERQRRSWDAIIKQS